MATQTVLVMDTGAENDSVPLSLRSSQTEEQLLYEEDDDDEDDDEYEYEREGLRVTFDNCTKGLGIKICGGFSSETDTMHGIFVARILPAGLADKEGFLNKGDQILEVNGHSLEGITNESAVAILRQASASNFVDMIITRDEQARSEFLEVFEKKNGFNNYIRSLDSAELQNSLSPRSDASQTGESPTGSDVGKEMLLLRESKGLNGEVFSTSPQHTKQNAFHSPSASKSVPDGSKMVPSMSSTPHVKQNSTSTNNTDDEISKSSELSVPSPVAGSLPSSLKDSFESSYDQHLPKSRHMSQSRKLSLDPHVRIKVEKLELALKYLGLEPTQEQHAEMRSCLHVDSQGTVNYGEFVQVAREVFRLQLDELNIGPSAMFFAAQDLTDITEPPAFSSEAMGIPSVDLKEDYETVCRERDHLKREVHRLKGMLREKEESCTLAENELLSYRRDVHSAVEESRSLRSKVHLAEQAQRAARTMEEDYEEVVRMLEGEITKLKKQLSSSSESPAVQRKIAILTCQLKKAESAKRTFEVSTEKLLNFAEHMHDILTGQVPERTGRRQENSEATGKNKQPGYFSKQKKVDPKTLANEAHEVVRAVKAIIDAEPLPFGWEEAYTSDGIKYYINHLTQTTSWSHPVSSIQHLPTVQEVRKPKTSEDPQTSQSNPVS